MREINIINSAHDREGEMVPGEILTRKRRLELFPQVSGKNLAIFVGHVRSEGGSKFCVSMVEGATTPDPNLMLFNIEVQDNQRPKIVFVGKGNIGGSIGVYNQYAAETWGYWVLKLTPQDL